MYEVYAGKWFMGEAVSIEDILKNYQPYNGRWQDLTIVDIDTNHYVPYQTLMQADIEMHSLSVNFYTTGNGKKRASIIDKGEALYMSEAEALKYLNGRLHLVGHAGNAHFHKMMQAC